MRRTAEPSLAGGRPGGPKAHVHAGPRPAFRPPRSAPAGCSGRRRLNTQAVTEGPAEAKSSRSGHGHPANQREPSCSSQRSRQGTDSYKDAPEAGLLRSL
jgi:hypothetical protein